jgi:hypothetical protein
MAVIHRSHLKNRFLVQGQGGSETQPAGILKYSEELKRGPNTEICPTQVDWAIRRHPSGYALTRKAVFEMASILLILFCPWHPETV